jgi:hypothetical protein
LIVDRTCSKEIVAVQAGLANDPGKHWVRKPFHLPKEVPLDEAESPSLASAKEVTRIVFNAVFLEKLYELLLEGSLLVMNLLVPDVPPDSFEL